MSNSVEFWYFLISLNAFIPGRYRFLFGFMTCTFPAIIGGALFAIGLSVVLVPTPVTFTIEFKSKTIIDWIAFNKQKTEKYITLQYHNPLF